MEKEYYVKIDSEIIDFSKTKILAEINVLIEQAITEFKNREIEVPKTESDPTFKSIFELVISNMKKMNVYEDTMYSYEEENSQDLNYEDTITPENEILNNLITQSFHQICSYVFKGHYRFKSINEYYDIRNQLVTTLDEVGSEMLFIKRNLIESLYSANSILKTIFIRKNYLAPLIASYLGAKEELRNIDTNNRILNNYLIASKAQSLSNLTEAQVVSLINQVKDIWKLENPNKTLTIQNIAELITDIWGIKVSRPTLSKFMKKHKISLNEK